VGALLLLLGLYLLPAATTGLWEPWETAPATLARSLADGTGGSVFSPMKGGELFARPWLQTLGLLAGYRIGDGSELGLRLPLIVMVVAAAASVYALLARWVGRAPAALAVVLFGTVPQVMLGATHLAADGYLVASTTICLAAIAHIAARDSQERGWGLALGLALALCVGARGIPGVAVPLGVMAVVAGATRARGGFSRAGLVAGAVPALALLVPAVATYLSAGEADGWEASKDLFGAAAAFGPSLLLLGAFGPVSRLRGVTSGVGAVLFGVAFVVVAGGAFAAAASQVGATEALRGLLYNTFFTSRTLPSHPTFDVMIRVVGYSLYPAIVFLPLAAATLARPVEDDAERCIRITLLSSFGLAFLVYGLGATLTRTYLMPVAFPLAAGIALALFDARTRRLARDGSPVWALAGFAALILLAVTTKDVAGHYNKELGIPGPQVLFESVFLDGAATFPDSYRLDLMKPLILLWGGLLFVGFFSPLRQLSTITSTLIAPLAGRFGRRIPDLAGSWASRLAVRVGAASAVAGGLALSAVGWGGELSVQAIPEASDHFSQKGILDSYERFARDGDKLYAAIPVDDASYYFGATSLERVPRVSELRNVFCEAEGRVFAVISAKDLGELYATLRRDDSTPCRRKPELFIVDGRSSRYQLASNELHPDRGEVDDNFVARSIFTKESIPATAKRVDRRVVVDGKLRLVAVELPTQVQAGEQLTVVTYWEVLSKLSTDPQMFIHVDFGGNRINGDHDLVSGKYPPRFWVQGDVVRDEHSMPVSRADKAGQYTVWGGLFRGDDRMTVSPKSGDNRIELGKVWLNRKPPASP
jgi:4-amino-4-deoxy-L-arabinose transferase-like glycosyltransferase